MFAKGDVVKEIGDGAGVVGHVVFVFDEIADGVTQQVITIQPIGTHDALLRITRLASELIFASTLTQDSEKGWILQ